MRNSLKFAKVMSQNPCTQPNKILVVFVSGWEADEPRIHIQIYSLYYRSAINEIIYRPIITPIFFLYVFINTDICRKFSIVAGNTTPGTLNLFSNCRSEYNLLCKHDFQPRPHLSQRHLLRAGEKKKRKKNSETSGVKGRYLSKSELGDLERCHCLYLLIN